MNRSTFRSQPQYPPPHRQPISKSALEFITKNKVDLPPQYLTIESSENEATAAETGSKGLTESKLYQSNKKKQKNTSNLDCF